VVSQAQHTLPPRQLAVLALGANQPSSLGKPDETISWACTTLSERIGSPIRKSRLFQTPAFPAGAGPDFVNAAVALETDVSAAQLLVLCHDLEQIAGRTRAVRWGQRTLDIDLIAFNGSVAPDAETHHLWRTLPLTDQATRTPDQLIVPHPRVQDRSFVLVPMMDVAPNWIHPILGLSTRQMLDARPEAEKAEIHLLDMA
jgi:2-amino-4-hydroxy-6-hydroxymethyldihydropteridine diphosphokinase